MLLILKVIREEFIAALCVPSHHSYNSQTIDASGVWQVGQEESR